MVESRWWNLRELLKRVHADSGTDSDARPLPPSNNPPLNANPALAPVALPAPPQINIPALQPQPPLPTVQQLVRNALDNYILRRDLIRADLGRTAEVVPLNNAPTGGPIVPQTPMQRDEFERFWAETPRNYFDSYLSTLELHLTNTMTMTHALCVTTGERDAARRGENEALRREQQAATREREALAREKEARDREQQAQRMESMALQKVARLKTKLTRERAEWRTEKLGLQQEADDRLKAKDEKLMRAKAKLKMMRGLRDQLEDCEKNMKLQWIEFEERARDYTIALKDMEEKLKQSTSGQSTSQATLHVPERGTKRPGDDQGQPKPSKSPREDKTD